MNWAIVHILMMMKWNVIFVLIMLNVSWILLFVGLTSFLNRIMQKILVAPGAISAANRAIYFSVSTRFCALCGRNTHLEILMLLPLFSPRPVGP